MAWALCLLTLLSYWSGASSLPSLTQLPSQSVPPGQMVKLSCTVSSDKNTICWVQQRSGQTPRLVQCAGYGRGPGIPDRFTASDSGNVGTLTITNTQAEDEADYYCHMWYGTGRQRIFGGGTRLTVTGQPASPPRVNLFPPSTEERQTKNKATMVCLVDRFNPGVVKVTWEADGATISNGVEMTTPTKLNDKYMASSYLTMDTSEWERHESFTCKVAHEGIVYPKTITRSQCP